MDRDDLFSGSVIGGYVVGQRIADGGMATIYEALQPGSPDPVALKILLPDLNGDKEYRERFLREATILQSLDHPHIVRLISFGEENGTLYIAMRLIRGMSVFELLTRRHFSPLTAWQILSPVAEALDYAHQRGIVHRDIKPGNILIEATTVYGFRGNSVYLADFGLSKIPNTRTLTRNGISMGTPQYMSPEQVLHQAITPQSDIYGLALVVYEMLLGRLPFIGNNPTEIALKHAREKPPDPQALNPQFPRPLADVLMRALEKLPAKRQDSANEFRMDYANAVEQIDLEARRADYWTAQPEG